jgi:hypothetical protein
MIGGIINSSDEQIRERLFDDGIIAKLLPFLKLNEQTNIVVAVLQSLQILLGSHSFSEMNNPAIKLQEMGMDLQLEDLQDSPNSQIYNLSSSLLQEYFKGEEILEPFGGQHERANSDLIN